MNLDKKMKLQGLKTVVLTSNKTSLPEIGLDNVLYFHPLKVEELKEQILRILNDKKLQDSYINKAYNYSKSFSWEKSALKHISLFEKILTHEES